VSIPRPAGIEYLDVGTTAELAQACAARFDACDVLLMAAAVADYRPAEQLEGKRPKDSAGWTVTLEPTTDVLRELGARRRHGQLLVGFAADRGDRGLERAREKLAAKRSDLIVFNDVSRDDIGFDASANEVVLVSPAGERRIQKAPKERIATEIFDEIVTLAGRADGRRAS
jgi:phosphopantothenoylcysteine decarboxylase / phosphopantothenate---cysteine ligase